MENEPLMDDALKRTLVARYEAPGRHYHGLSHIEAMLAFAAEYGGQLADVRAVEAAIWFHDAVYDSARKDNEALSADMAEDQLAGRTGSARLDRIKAMILATATHQLPHLPTEAAKRDAALFLDMDLAILGAPAPAFDAYEQAVRQEYAWVPDDGWRSGRSAVLRTFLEREQIFNTEQFRSRFEKQARQNLDRSLSALSR